MAQIITNTFFDDCLAIVNINGRPSIDLVKMFGAVEEDGTWSIYLDRQSGQDLKFFSKRFIDGLPSTAQGVQVVVSEDGEIIASTTLDCINEVGNEISSPLVSVRNGVYFAKIERSDFLLSIHFRSLM